MESKELWAQNSGLSQAAMKTQGGSTEKKRNTPLTDPTEFSNALGYFFTFPFLHTFPGSVTSISALQAWLSKEAFMENKAFAWWK